MSKMGIFRTNIAIAPLWPHRESRRDAHELQNVVVDTGSEMTWVPTPLLEVAGVEREGAQTFETSDGRVLSRETGWAIIYAGGRAAPTVVVFAEPDDTILLGAIAIESLNLRVDLMSKKLVPAGPSPAYSCSPPRTRMEQPKAKSTRPP